MVDRFKEASRLTYRLVRKNLTPTYQRHTSIKVCARIRSLKQFRYAKRIALYQAMHGEIDLNHIWQSAPLQGKYCYFPALNDDRSLSFLPATPKTPFNQNYFGIDEPDVDRELALMPEQLDIIFIPLVAFDKKGTRLGMGAGYYDRTLEHGRAPLLIGVAYEFQRLSFIPAQPWDIPLTVIITECNTYWSPS